MKTWARCFLATLLLAGIPLVSAQAQPAAKGESKFDMIGLLMLLKGRLVDHTHNHGLDNRIWSRSLHQWRDLYIYLPPGFNKTQCYPIIMYLHPFLHDEQTFLRIIPEFDHAMASGKLPPAIIVAPDGSMDGRISLTKPGSFFLNSGAGPYEDYILQDVWDFVTCRYPIRPERCAHVLMGVSMGGFAAFNIGMRHRNAFGIVIGLNPPLNLRWADVNGNPRAKFDPRRWGWRTGYDTPLELVASYAGVVNVLMGHYIEPVFGVGDEALLNIANNNPIELIGKTCLRNGELAMFVGYGGKDEFNVDAQVESFLYYSKFKGLSVAVAFEPHGHHDLLTAKKFLPSAIRWLAPQLEPYAPACGPPPGLLRALTVPNRLTEPRPDAPRLSIFPPELFPGR